MRIAGNKLRHLKDFFHRELNEKFAKDEIEALFNTAAGKYLHLTRTEILLHLDSNLNQSDLLLLYDCAKDLKKDIPLQYILKEAWFYNLPFYVDRSVLIPRPETEELVEMILKENMNPKSLMDIGTGSGCIPVAFKKNREDCKVFACDISEKALLIASENAAQNGMEIEFVQGDILREDILPTEKFEIIVSNPPYIKKEEASEMSAHVLDHEPHLALFVEGDDVIVFYRRIIDYAVEHLLPEGKLYFELNPLTAKEVVLYAQSKKEMGKCSLVKDMSGKDRFFVGRRQG
jgi:release factor glutamine methyltransferase